MTAYSYTGALLRDVVAMLHLATSLGAPRIIQTKILLFPDILPEKVLLERLFYVRVHTTTYPQLVITYYILNAE